MAIDLQPMAPIEGVIQVQGDITNARTAEVVNIDIITPYNFFISLYFSFNYICTHVYYAYRHNISFLKL